jgi:hypothetical protein
VTWHADPDLLERYAAGRLPDAAAWSLETHVNRCDACRLDLVPTAGLSGDRLSAIWADVDGRVRAAERPALERILVRGGVPEHHARLLLATPSLTRSWLVGVVIVLVLAVAGAWSGPVGGAAPLPFLLLAPLLPVAGVALAFGPRVDPAHDLTVIAPMASSRLLLSRTVAVLATSFVSAGIGTLALPVLGWAVAGWMLPALTLTAVTLAVSTRWDPLPAAATVAGAWIALVVGAEAASAVPLAAFGPGGQALAATLLVVSVVVLGRRLDRFELAVHP